MAITLNTHDEVLELEDSLRDVVEGFRQIRTVFQELDKETLKLNIKTARGHIKWLKQWATSEPGKAKSRNLVDDSQEKWKEKAGVKKKLAPKKKKSKNFFLCKLELILKIATIAA